MSISSFSSIALSLVSAAILSRYFDKTEYGTYKQVIYVYSSLTLLFAAGLPSAYAYFLPKLSMDQGKDVIAKLNRLFVAFGIGFAIFLFLFAGLIANVLNNPELKTGLRLFSPIPLFLFPTLGLEGIYTALRKTYVVAIYTTATRLFMLLLIVLPVILFNGTYQSAIMGWVIASFLSLLLALYLKNKPYRDYEKQTSSVTYRNIFKYSIPLMVATIGGIMIRTSDQFYISRYFGTETFADYSNGFVPLPFIAMVTGAIHAVFVPLFSRLEEKENGNLEIAATWKRGVNKAVILLFPILIYFFIFANEIILILYGPLYDKSYIYFRLSMVVNFFMPFLFYSILLAKGKTQLYATMHIVHGITIWLFGYFIAKYTQSPFYYVAFSVLLAVAARQVGLYFAAKSLNVSLIKLIDINKIVKILIPFSILCLAIYYVSNILFKANLPVILFSGTLYFSILFIADYLWDIGFIKIAKGIFKKEKEIVIN